MPLHFISYQTPNLNFNIQSTTAGIISCLKKNPNFCLQESKCTNVLRKDCIENNKKKILLRSKKIIELETHPIMCSTLPSVSMSINVQHKKIAYIIV